MSGAVHDLYRGAIVEHAKRPRNFRCLSGHAAIAESYNPLCGDAVTVYIELTDGVVRDAAFQGVACAVSTASASMMTEAVQGRAPAEIAAIGDAFAALVTGGSTPAMAVLNGLAAFAAVRGFPSRVQCALLPWRALRAALQLPE